MALYQDGLCILTPLHWITHAWLLAISKDQLSFPCETNVGPLKADLKITTIFDFEWWNVMRGI